MYYVCVVHGNLRIDQKIEMEKKRRKKNKKEKELRTQTNQKKIFEPSENTKFSFQNTYTYI